MVVTSQRTQLGGLMPLPFLSTRSQYPVVPIAVHEYSILKYPRLVVGVAVLPRKPLSSTIDGPCFLRQSRG